MTTIHHHCKRLKLRDSQIKHRCIFSIWNKSKPVTLFSKHYFIYFLNIGQTNPQLICLLRDFSILTSTQSGPIKVFVRLEGALPAHNVYTYTYNLLHDNLFILFDFINTTYM